MIIRLPYKFSPREYQKESFDAFFRDNIKHALLIRHRRSGKDKESLNILIGKALQRVGNYLYLLPQQNQVREVVWDAIDGEGMSFLDHIPPEIIYKKNSTKMTVTLVNGSRIKFTGSDNYNSLMGTNPVGIVQSEFSLHHPLARAFFRPILTQNGGWELLQGTVRGQNHCYDLFNLVKNNPNWLVRVSTIQDTFQLNGNPVITEYDIEEERRNGMSEELIQQEYYCNWNVGNVGAYFTKEMSSALNEGRIKRFDINPNLPVFTFWDIGVRDSTAICFMQPYQGRPRFVYYIEGNNQGIDYYAKEIRAVEQRFGFRCKYHWAPHDIENREWGASARSRISIAQDFGIHFLIVPNLSIQDRIAAGRKIIGECDFHEEHCSMLIHSLREAQRKYDSVRKIFEDKPLHNWALHGFDAFTYFGVVWQQSFIRPEMQQPHRFNLDAFEPGGAVKQQHQPQSQSFKL